MKLETEQSNWVNRIYKMREFRELLDLPADEKLVTIYVGWGDVKVVTSKKAGG